ncbi:MAG TPA: DinB family protein [Vicinamibacterales bacterium]|nr:DinB family protein [Vicinamibacterales bacterium]
MARTVFVLTAAIALTASIAWADEAGDAKALANAWNRIKRLNTAAAQAMPDANYAFKPAPEVRSFGEIVGHLANEHYMICSDVKGAANPQKTVDFEKKTTKAELVKALNDSYAYCEGVAPKDEKTFANLLVNVTHDSEHYGNLVTYMRMKGIVPPSSQPSR